MANRGATAAVRSEWGKAQNEVCHLFEAYFDSEVARATEWSHDIEWPAGSGNIYKALGHFLSFSGIEEVSELRVHETDVVLSGVDQVWVSLVLAEQYIDRRLVIYKAFLNGAGGLVLDPVPIFDGRMDAPDIAEDPDTGACVVTIRAASHWADFERRPGRHTNHEEQQLYFAGDKGFEYVSEIARETIWGAPSAAGQAPLVTGAAPRGLLAPMFKSLQR